MFKNYLTTALRNLRKRPGYTSINVAGLGLGLAAAILIALFARHELTYNRFHEHADETYLVYKERLTPTGTQETYDTWVPLLPRLRAAFPGIENGTQVYTQQDWVQRGNERFEETVTYTDSSFFEVFTFPLVRGNAASALADRHAVVLSRQQAEKYFGAEDPLGQTLTLNFETEYTVTGVLEDYPPNSTIEPEMLVLLASAPDYENFRDNWDSSFLFTFVRLAEQTPAAQLEAQFPTLVAGIWDDEVAGRTNLKLLPLGAVYDTLTGNRQYAFILLGIALAIILIACINFINLATARSMERVREIGVRKALGAHRWQLQRQILTESLLLGLLALVLGVALAQVLLPVFNDLYQLELRLGLFESPWALAALLGIGLVVGLLSGSYPALFLARFDPAQALHGSFKTSPGGLRLRHTLVVFQFTLSIVLIAGTAVMWQQIQYLKNQDLAFERENLVVLPVEVDDFAEPEEAALRLETFKNEVAQLAEVRAVTSTARVPGDGYGSFAFAVPEGGDPEQPQRLQWTANDEHFFDAFGIRLVEGRTFLAGSEQDRSSAIVINDAARRAFGWDSGVGKTIHVGNRPMEVVGVVEDYHFEALLSEVAPLLHIYRPPEGGVHNYVVLKTRSGDYGATLAQIEQAWQRLDPTRSFDYFFVDENFDELYRAQDRLVAVASAFALLAILIACLGLFGLASLMVAQRLKEIGVRKVLGASVGSIILLLSKRFAALVLVGFLLAAPAAYLLMNQWLDGFAYRIAVGAGTLALAGLLALAVALLTVSVQAIRAALADPVRSLRYE